MHTCKYQEDDESGCKIPTEENLSTILKAYCHARKLAYSNLIFTFKGRELTAAEVENKCSKLGLTDGSVIKVTRKRCSSYGTFPNHLKAGEAFPPGTVVELIDLRIQVSVWYANRGFMLLDLSSLRTQLVK
jgi:hypothetical protein